MNRLMYFGGLFIILLVSFVLFNACKGDDSGCQYDDNGQGAGTSYLPDYIEFCNDEELANGPSNPASGQMFNLSVFKQMLRDSLPSHGGIQYAIIQDGTVYLSYAEGMARETLECPEMELTACNKMNIASVTKMMTAATTLKLLNDLGLDETATIGSYLPDSWEAPSSMGNLTFRQMLSHRSGLQQYTANNDFDNTLSYEGLRTLAKIGPDADSIGLQRYLNANAAMMRIIIPELWRGLASCPTELLNATEIDDALSQKYYEEAIRTFVFQPVGADGELDAADLGDFETLYYNSTPDDGVSSGNWKNKAGGGGWNMTAEDMAKVIDGIFNGTIVSTEIADDMRTKVMGIWNYLSTFDGQFVGHGGDISWDAAAWHNLLVHNTTTNVSIAVNINKPNGATSLYSLIPNAYDAAWE